MLTWQPSSWQHKHCGQPVHYPTPSVLDRVLEQLICFPPLVSFQEIQLLKQSLAEAAQGKCFVLQGGDCAETFAHCNEGNITNTLKILLQMALVLSHGLKKPVVKIGRIAGQYAKPRTKETETRGDQQLPAYRGDLVNGIGFDQDTRTPDPQRLIQGYHYAALTMNYIRALVKDGFTDIKNPENWDIAFMSQSPNTQKYRAILSEMQSAFQVLSQTSDYQLQANQAPKFFVSHEALNLHYEAALTRLAPNNAWYNVSTHFPWVGMRTNDIDGAHVEYVSGIANPIAVKIGPDTDEKWLATLIHQLNPSNEPGRLTLVTRLGADRVGSVLPKLIRVVQSNYQCVVWLCDPMHGNTQLTKEGFKTRSFNRIVKELQLSTQIHQELGSVLAGIHVELTGNNVTECIGGARGLDENDLSQFYTSLVDPRLNYEQALELGFSLVSGMDGNKGANPYAKP